MGGASWERGEKLQESDPWGILRDVLVIMEAANCPWLVDNLADGRGGGFLGLAWSWIGDIWILASEDSDRQLW